MNIQISVGEALDRLSILEIKQKYIEDVVKKTHIVNEIETLSEIQDSKIKYKYYYDLLVGVNTQIWNHTNVIKTLDSETVEYGKLAHTIFELNQSRFRLKQIVNTASSSLIQEQKSYAVTWTVVDLKDTEVIDIQKFSELSLQYDRVQIYCSTQKRLEFETMIPKFNYVFLQYSDVFRL